VCCGAAQVALLLPLAVLPFVAVTNSPSVVSLGCGKGGCVRVCVGVGAAVPVAAAVSPPVFPCSRLRASPLTACVPLAPPACQRPGLLRF
jgi:hypothetical protein